MHGTIDLPPLQRAADLLPASLDEKDRSIEVVWSAGARVRRQPFFGEPFDEELSMDPAQVHLERLNAGAPLLKVHDRFALEAVIGSVVPGTARIENGRGVARVRFSEREDVAPIWNDIRSGHLRAVSVGYQVQRYEITRPSNGPELWRAVDWTPFEISAVPVGADPAAGFRSVDRLMPCVVDRDDATPSQENHHGKCTGQAGCARPERDRRTPFARDPRSQGGRIGKAITSGRTSGQACSGSGRDPCADASRPHGGSAGCPRSGNRARAGLDDLRSRRPGSGWSAPFPTIW